MPYPHMLNLQTTDPIFFKSQIFNICLPTKKKLTAPKQLRSQHLLIEQFILDSATWAWQPVNLCLLRPNPKAVNSFWGLDPTKAMSALATSGGEVTRENSIKKREIENFQIFWECTNIHQLNLRFWKLLSWCWLNTWPVAWPLSVFALKLKYPSSDANMGACSAQELNFCCHLRFAGSLKRFISSGIFGTSVS